MPVDISTLRALAEAANEPPPDLRRLSAAAGNAASLARSHAIWRFRKATPPAVVLRLLAVAEAACRFGFDRQRGHLDQHMRGCACFDGGHCNCGCPELHDALAALKGGDNGR